MTAFLDDMEWDSEESLLFDWENDRRKHPFVINKMNDDGVRALWEASSVNYNGLEYASIREEIAKS